MSECTETGKPLIAILMAVYEPRMDWLEEQLDSLERQTYPNLKLYVRDDASTTVPFETIEKLVKACIHSFPYEIQRNEKNLGSNKTFERLTQEAGGEYFAYCDQDDVWLPEKLAILQEEIERTGALLVCSDMFIIDGSGKQVADSITRIRRHHVFRSGGGLAPKLLFHNFVTGCTALARSMEAKAAVPFCPDMVHDHYLALWCAERGEVISVKKPLIRYRIHDNNQTLLLAGVHDKASYGIVRIHGMLERLCWLQKYFPCGENLSREINRGIDWVQAREDNWKHKGGREKVWKYRQYSLLPALFELTAVNMPEGLFRFCIHIGRRNWV